MSVRGLGEVSETLWLDVARRCPYATFFHTPMWATLMVRSYPALSMATRGFRLEDGTSVIVPMLEARKHGPPVRLSMFPGVYGGPIAPRHLSASEIDAVLESLRGFLTRPVHVFGNPFLDPFRIPAPDAGSELTHVVSLEGGFERTFARFHQNHRRSYRYALRKGLTRERARTENDYREYYEVYVRDRQRWGARAGVQTPRRFFDEIRRLGDDRIVLWIARCEGRIVAGDVWLYWNDHSVGWHGAADPDFFKTFPTNFLITELIRDACERGDRWFDLNPSGGHEGVARFKDSFGAERLHFRHRAVAEGAAFRMRKRLVQRISRLRGGREGAFR